MHVAAAAVSAAAERLSPPAIAAAATATDNDAIRAKVILLLIVWLLLFVSAFLLLHQPSLGVKEKAQIPGGPSCPEAENTRASRNTTDALRNASLIHHYILQQHEEAILRSATPSLTEAITRSAMLLAVFWRRPLNLQLRSMIFGRQSLNM